MVIGRYRIRQHPWVLGSAFALLAYGLLACQDAIVKSLVSELSVWQILCVRSGCIAGACLVAAGPRVLRSAIVSPVRGFLVGRGAVSLAAWLCYFTAARSLPLSQLTTLYAAAPVLAVLIAIPLLGERVARLGWLAVGLGFAGAVAACDPAQLSVSPSAVLVLLGAAFWACGMVIMRRIGRRKSSVVQLFSNSLLFFLVTAVGSVTNWQSPAAWQILPVLGMAVLGGLGQLCLIESARLAPVWLTAPLQYSGLLWAFILGFVFWGSVPTLSVSCGAVLIVAAGIAVLHVPRNATAKSPADERDEGSQAVSFAKDAPCLGGTKP